MTWIALKMLTGDRAKYLGIVFGVAFASLLISHQLSIFISVMARTTYLMRNVQEGEVWVMDPNVRQVDEVMGLSDDDLHRVRGVEGVAWAVKLYRGNVRARLAEGNDLAAHGDFRSVILIGLDDATLVGAPRKMLLGKVEDLNKPDAVIIDEAGYHYLFPDQPHRLGQVVEMTDRRAEIVGICEVGQPFQSQPIFYTKYDRAMTYSPPERRPLSYIVVEPAAGVSPKELAGDWAPSQDARRVHVDDDRLLSEEHRHPVQLRDHGNDRVHRRRRDRRADALPVHDREPETVRGAQGDGDE
jgi:putative ABC transport system permease protein